MSENAYIIMVLFFVLFVLILMSLDFQDDIRKWLKRRAEKKRQSDVSEEAERAEGSSSEDLWEEIMRENQREQWEQLEARERDQRTMAELRRIRMMRESREEMLRNYHEQMEEQRHRRDNNTTQGDYVHHHMGTWNMADSPRPTEAPAPFTVGDIVKLEFPEHERFIHGDYSWQHPRQTTEGLLHGQYVILRHQHPGAPYLWDVAVLNEADCPPSMIGRQLVVREKYFIKKQPAPAIVYPKKVKLTEGGLPKL